MSHGSKLSHYQLPCGCVITHLSENVERILKQCDCCAAEFNERHQASVESCSHVYRAEQERAHIHARTVTETADAIATERGLVSA